jgi:hypothetical protein
LDGQTKIHHTGRGGAGNTRSPSTQGRVQERLEDGLEERLVAERRGREAMAEVPFSTGRGGAGESAGRIGFVFGDGSSHRRVLLLVLFLFFFSCSAFSSSPRPPLLLFQHLSSPRCNTPGNINSSRSRSRSRQPSLGRTETNTSTVHPSGPNGQGQVAGGHHESALHHLFGGAKKSSATTDGELSKTSSRSSSWMVSRRGVQERGRGVDEALFVSSFWCVGAGLSRPEEEAGMGISYLSMRCRPNRRLR